MARRVMFIQLKSGHGLDAGPARISVVEFTRSWQTAYWHGRTLRRVSGVFDANFLAVDTDEEFWISGPHRDRGDTRFTSIRPTVDPDARTDYEAFLAGAALPGRESG